MASRDLENLGNCLFGSSFCPLKDDCNERILTPWNALQLRAVLSLIETVPAHL